MGRAGKFGGKGRLYRPGHHAGKGKGAMTFPATATQQGAQAWLAEEPPTPGIPTWNGDGETFQAFLQDIDWYVTGLKQNEKHLAVARVWANLRGAARLAVNRLKAEDFEGTDGLEKLKAFLSKTPLAKQPLPDAYQKIDQYRAIKRMRGESAAEYVLREAEAYSKMGEALRKLKGRNEQKEQRLARRTRRRHELRCFRQGVDPDSEDAYWLDAEAEADSLSSHSDEPEDGPHSAEIRGYQLLRNARLAAGEKQTLLAHTANSTSFDIVRAALITWWENEEELRGHDGGVARAYLFAEDVLEEGPGDEPSYEDVCAQGYADAADEWPADAWQGDDWWTSADWSDNWHGDEDAYWGGSGDASSSDWQGSTWAGQGEREDCPDATKEQIEGLAKAQILAADSRRTLAEARAAVAGTRQDREFYNPGKPWGGAIGKS